MTIVQHVLEDSLSIETLEVSEACSLMERSTESKRIELGPISIHFLSNDQDKSLMVIQSCGRFVCVRPKRADCGGHLLGFHVPGLNLFAGAPLPAMH